MAERAAARFDGLRAAVLERGVPADALTALPAGYCVSAIARLAVNDATAVDALIEAQRRLAGAVPLGYAYPAESLHVTLIGCTQREPAADFAAHRLDRIGEAVRVVTGPVAPVAVRLGRTTLAGGQFFVEMITDDPAWAGMRTRLAEELRGRGESPIVHPDNEPMHVNLARADGALSPERVAAALDAAGEVGRELELALVEVVVTDFLVTPAALRVVEAVQLSARRPTSTSVSSGVSGWNVPPRTSR